MSGCSDSRYSSGSCDSIDVSGHSDLTFRRLMSTIVDVLHH